MALQLWNALTFGLASGQSIPDGGATVSPALSANVNSDPQDCASIQAVSLDVTIAGGAVTGSLQLQGSNGSTGGKLPGGAAPGPNWYSVGSAVPVAASGPFGVTAWPFPYRFMRLAWIAGTGGVGVTMSVRAHNKGFSQ